VLAQDLLAVGILLYKLHGLKATQPLRSEAESANAAEGVKDA
jgi:hypothetical protein